MRKHVLLIACLVLGALGINAGVWGQSTQVFSLNSRIPDPALSVSVSPNSLQPTNLFNQTETLTATGAGGEGTLSYSWSPTTGLSDPNSATPTLSYDNGTRPTMYVLTVTDELGCQDTAQVIINYSVAREAETQLPISMQILPNPSNGFFHLTLKGEPLTSELEIAVLDQMGRRVFEESNGRFTGRLDRDIDLSNLTSGIYFLGLESGGKTAFSKIIIQ